MSVDSKTEAVSAELAADIAAASGLLGGLAILDKSGSLLFCNDGFAQCCDPALAPGAGLDALIAAMTNDGKSAAALRSTLVQRKPFEIALGRDDRQIIVKASPIGADRMALATSVQPLADLGSDAGLLRDLLDNLPQGVVIFDADLRLVMCNQVFRELAEMPPEFTQPGSPLADHIRFVIERGDGEGEATEEYIQQRVDFFRSTESYVFDRRLANGRVIQNRGKRLPDGGLVATFTDITAQRRAESRQDWLRSLSDNVNAVVFIKDKDGRYLLFNKRGTELLGLREADILGKTDFDIFPDQAVAFQAADRKVIDSQQTETIEEFVAGRHFMTIKMPIISDGEVQGIAAIATDVTAAREQEDKFRQQGAWLRAIVENAGLAIWLKNLDGRYLLANRDYLSLINKDFAEIEGKTDFEVLPKPDAEQNEESDEIAREPGKVWESESTILVDGRARSFHTRKMSIIGHDGNTIGICSIAADITERRAGENKLRQREIWLRGVIDNIGALIYLKDSEGRYLLANQPFLDFVGQSSASLEGKRDFELMPPTEADACRSSDTLAVQRRGTIEVEEVFNTPKGQRLFLSRKVPIYNDDGSIMTICGVATDITARKQSEQALLEAKQLAEQANRAKSTFLANISHELRTPLNAIIGFSEMMKEGMLGPIQNESYFGYAKDIHFSGRHLLEIVDDLLDLSRIEVGRFHLSNEMVDIGREVSASIAMVQTKAMENGLTISQPSGQAPLLRSDHRAFRQILINLLTNAVKFTSAGGNVQVDWRTEETGGITILVIDTGRGIPQESIDRVLQPFQQVDPELADKSRGVGLGLALCKALMELHDGEIAIDSELGKGTTVSLRFPADRVIRY